MLFGLLLKFYAEEIWNISQGFSLTTVFRIIWQERATLVHRWKLFLHTENNLNFILPRVRWEPQTYSIHWKKEKTWPSGIDSLIFSLKQEENHSFSGPANKELHLVGKFWLNQARGAYRHRAHSTAVCPGHSSLQELEVKPSTALKSRWEKREINLFTHAFVWVMAVATVLAEFNFLWSENEEWPLCEPQLTTPVSG